MWIHHNSIMPSFITLVTRKMPLMVGSLILLIIFSFLRLTIRIGPLYKLNHFSDRNIIEHLLAAGHFVRKRGNISDQIKQTRDYLEKKITAKYLYYSKKSRAEQIEMIAKWTGMTDADVYLAMENPVKTTHEYIKTTMLIKNIEDEIVANYKKN